MHSKSNKVNCHEKKYNYKDDEEDSKWNGFNPLWGIGGGIQYKFIRLDIGGEFGLTIKDDEKWNKPIYLGLSFLF